MEVCWILLLCNHGADNNRSYVTNIKWNGWNWNWMNEMHKHIISFQVFATTVLTTIGQMSWNIKWNGWAIYQTLPIGSFFEEKVPFHLILIQNEMWSGSFGLTTIWNNKGNNFDRRTEARIVSYHASGLKKHLKMHSGKKQNKCNPSCRQFESTFENTQWRKVQQMQPV